MQLLLAALLFGPGPEAETAPPPTLDAPAVDADLAPTRFDLALLRAQGLDPAQLRSELELRLPELELRPHQDAASIEDRTDPYLYLEAQRRTKTDYRIAIIASDGRGYYEDVDVGEAVAPERVVAATIANLIFSIQEGSLAPDRQDAEIPPAELEATEKPATETEAETETDAPVPPDEAPPPAPPKVEIGLGLGAGLGTGIGPPEYADRHLGFFGGFELELRTRGGFFGALAFHSGGRTKDDFRLTRFRTSIGAGYAWRGEHAEVATALTLAFEPWVVASDTGPEPVSRDGESGRPPLLSWAVRLSPGYLIRPRRDLLQAVRIGPRIDLGGGFVASKGPVVAGLQTADGTELFRLGGAELFTGIELVLWLGRSPK